MAAVVCAIIPLFIEGYQVSHTCALCRQVRTEYHSMGRTWRTTYRANDCTDFYATHIESKHQHVWVRAGTTVGKNLYGYVRWIADGEPPGYVIWRISPEEYIEMYRRIDDPKESKRVFKRIAELDGNSGIHDREALWLLTAWRDSGFQKPADEVVGRIK